MKKKALIVIDVQKGIVNEPGMHNVPDVLSRIRDLQDRARRSGVPVLHVQHDGAPGHRVEPQTPGWSIDPRVAPVGSEPVIHKQANDAFFQTSLQQQLQTLGITDVIIAGCMTQYCVDTTCRRAVTLGYDVTLASDAHSTSDEGGLTAEQIIHHHNTLLDGFAAAGHAISIRSSSTIQFNAEE